MSFDPTTFLLSTWGKRLQVAVLLSTVALLYWAPDSLAPRLLAAAVLAATSLPQLRNSSLRQRLAFAAFLLSLPLLFFSASAPVGLLAMLVAGFLMLRPPVVLPSNVAELGEGGIRDRSRHRWIAFHDIEKVDYDDPKLELRGKGNKRLAAWSQPHEALPMLRELEAGVHAARSASDPLQLGRGELTTEAWLSSLDRRFRGDSQYRCPAIAADQLAGALGNTANRCDVRAGAAFALLASDPAAGTAIVRNLLNASSPPLLSAVCAMLSPGIADDESLAEARRYLTREERAAIDSFAKRSARPRFRVAIEPPADEAVEIEAEAGASPHASERRV